MRHKQTVLLLASYANRPYTKSPSECTGSMRANDVSKHDYLSGANIAKGEATPIGTRKNAGHFRLSMCAHVHLSVSFSAGKQQIDKDVKLHMCYISGRIG